jgi:hypothetical protein
MKRFLVPSLALALLTLAAPAGAQITQRTVQSRPDLPPDQPDFVASDGDLPSYEVKFKEDEIDATLLDGSIPRIVVRPVRGFSMLARPRTHFVPELLKSVEIM